MEEKTKNRFAEVLQCESDEIHGLIQSISMEEITGVKKMLAGCKGKIITTGCGTSGAAAKKIAHTLNCTELPALFLSPAEALHGGLGVVTPEDVVVLVSKGGRSFEMDSILTACLEKKAPTIAVTENRDTFLAQNVSQILCIRVDKEPDTFNMLATASTLAVIAVFDAIAIMLSEENGFTKEHFYCIHPGGEVGERLQRQLNR